MLTIAATLLATGAAIATMACTKGKKTPASVEKTINKYIANLKNTAKNYFRGEPVVTKLKNGGFKYEFKDPSSNFVDTLIFDKSGKFKQYIVFSKEGNRVKYYAVYKAPIENKKYLLKEVNVHRMPLTDKANKVNTEINMKRYNENGICFRNSIKTTGNDKVTVVNNNDNGTITRIFKKENGKLGTVTQSTVSADYIVKPGAGKSRIPDLPHVLNNEERAVSLELLSLK